MSESIVASEAQARAACSGARRVVVQGAPGSGKSTALALRVAHLLQAGAASSDVLVVVPSRSAAAPMRGLLRAAAGQAGDAVEVRTIHEVAARILDTPQARELIGREPRLLAPFEQAFLEEDLKTLGIAPRRLREMLKFLERGITELREGDPEFIVMVEERMAINALRDHLTQRRAMLACEFSAFALRVANELGSAGLARAHVVADDWTSLGLASQRLCEALALQTLTTSGYAEDPGVACEPYPHRDGLAALGEHAENDVEQIMLPARSASSRTQRNVCWEFPGDELDGIADLVAKRVERGARRCDIAVLAPNRPWGRNMAAELRERGLGVQELLGATQLTGDPRSAQSCVDLRAMALLMLAADPRDVLAWRSWVGFGDRLLCSAAWKCLRAYCAEHGLDLIDTLLDLPQVEYPPFVGGERLGASVREGLAALEQVRGLAGQALLDAIAKALGARPSRLADMLDPISEKQDAAALASRARELACDPAFDDDPSLVRVGTYAAFAGTQARVAVMGGLVDGFTPDRTCFDTRLDQDKLRRNLDRQRLVFERAAALASEELIYSRFKQEWLFDAEPAGMQVDRISADPRGRLATIKRSTYLRELEDAGAIPQATGMAVHP